MTWKLRRDPKGPLAKPPGPETAEAAAGTEAAQTAKATAPTKAASAARVPLLLAG